MTNNASLTQATEFNEFMETVRNDNTGTNPAPSLVRSGSRYDNTVTDIEDQAVRSTKASSMWAIYNGTNYVSCDETINILPPGMYSCQESQALGAYLRKERIVLDDLISLPDHASQTIMKDIDTFWSKQEHFKKLGFVWKRGVLLWGPPGSGKTSCLQQISADFIGRGGICIYMSNPKTLVHIIRMLRVVEPTRPVAILMEDLDSIVYEYGESDILALMDGELQIDNVLFIASTNYPEKLDKRLICRPSRFDIVRKVGMPSPAARKIYLYSKNTRLQQDDASEELDNWVQLTSGFSIAHLKELIISVEVFELPVGEVITRLKSMLSSTPSSTDSDNGFGFTTS